MSVRSVALKHYRARQRLVQVVAALARQLWAQLATTDLDTSWARLMPRLMVPMSGAQLAAAAAADPYLSAALAEQALSSSGAGRVNARALSGISADGRTLDTLLARPVIAVKTALAAGEGMTAALATGYANLDMITRTEVADAGRVADQIALTAHPDADGYVRMAVGKTCSRCLILAGRRYRWNQGFDRHPRCDCIHIPAREDSADDLRTNPRGAFDAMSREEQDRTFTKVGAEAIREGADMNRVVNARRGMYVAGGRQFTTEATTRRGANRIRLMPEQIFREADGNRGETLRLLRLHGYIV
jgi:hypothetical protein